MKFYFHTVRTVDGQKYLYASCYSNITVAFKNILKKEFIKLVNENNEIVCVDTKHIVSVEKKKRNKKIAVDTVIPKLVEVFNHSDIIITENSSISNSEDSRSRAFYILNDDLTMTLIWTKEKGLVS